MERTLELQEVVFSTAVKYKEHYYLAGQNVNGLFRYSEKNNQLDYLFPFKAADQYSNLYYLSFLHNNKAWFIPYRTEEIAVVDLDELTAEYIPLEYNHIFNRSTVKFLNYCLFNEHYVFLVPDDVDIAVIIDLDTYEKSVFAGIASKDRQYGSAVYLNEKIIMFPWKGNVLISIDINSNTVNEYFWDNGNNLYGGCIVNLVDNTIIHAPYIAIFINNSTLLAKV